MEIKRDITAALLEWEQRPERKPLIIQGARQIGKTWIMRKFGEEYFDHVAYFNFDASEELCREFENTKNPERLIDILRLYTEYPIEPGRTLIIFDEIQQSNKALNSLKYFCEEAPEYHILAAGSLLGVSLSQGDSFPVGKVEFLKMYPVTFREFLRADRAVAGDRHGMCRRGIPSLSGLRRDAGGSCCYARQTRRTGDRGDSKSDSDGICAGFCQTRSG